MQYTINSFILSLTFLLKYSSSMQYSYTGEDPCGLGLILSVVTSLIYRNGETPLAFPLFPESYTITFGILILCPRKAISAERISLEIVKSFLFSGV